MFNYVPRATYFVSDYVVLTYRKCASNQSLQSSMNEGGRGGRVGQMSRTFTLEIKLKVTGELFEFIPSFYTIFL